MSQFIDPFIIFVVALTIVIGAIGVLIVNMHSADSEDDTQPDSSSELNSKK